MVGLEGSQEAKSTDEVPLTGPLAIVVGSEGEGIRSLVRTSLRFSPPPAHDRQDRFAQCFCSRVGCTLLGILGTQ